MTDVTQRGAKYNFFVAADLMVNPNARVPPIPENNAEFSMNVSSRRKGSRRAGPPADPPASVLMKSPIQVVPVDVARKLQLANDQVDRLKGELQTLKGQKAEAIKQADQANAKLEKIQAKLGAAEESKRNGAVTTKALKGFGDQLKVIQSESKATTKASELSQTAVESLKADLAQVRKEVSNVSMKLSKVDDALRELVSKVTGGGAFVDERASMYVKKTKPNSTGRSPSTSGDDSPTPTHRKKMGEGVKRKSSSVSKKSRPVTSSSSEDEPRRRRKERRAEVSSSDESRNNSKKSGHRHRK